MFQCGPDHCHGRTTGDAKDRERDGGLDLIFLLIALIVDEMPSVAILRVFKLLRLARIFKAAKSFKELNVLLRSCASALRAIFWGMVMVFMALTVWGILAVQDHFFMRLTFSRRWFAILGDIARTPMTFPS